MIAHIYKRQYERVRLSASAKIFIGDKKIDGLRTKDISLSGIYVTGKIVDCQSGPCRISIQGTWLDTEPIVLNFSARVSRQGYSGTGFQITQMNHVDFETLQTFLLYGSPDPMDHGLAFARHCPFEVGNIEETQQHGQPISNLTC